MIAAATILRIIGLVTQVINAGSDALTAWNKANDFVRDMVEKGRDPTDAEFEQLEASIKSTHEAIQGAPMQGPST